MANPYILLDTNNIIDAFTSPPDSTTLEGREQWKDYIPPGTEVGKWLADFPNMALDEWGGASLGLAFEKVHSAQEEAKEHVRTFFSYGTAASGTSYDYDVNLGFTKVKGLEMSNTFYTISQASNAEEVLGTIVADCIPCKDRILSLLQLNPLEDLWNLIDLNYKRMFGILYDLYDMLFGDKSYIFFSDFCSLFDFLNFMCIPDLTYMMTVLYNLMMKYSLDLSDIKITFNAFLEKMLGPALTPIASLIEKYLQLFFAPVECVIEALDSQMAKLEVVQRANILTSQYRAEQERSPDKQPFPKKRESFKRDITIFSEVGFALKELKRTLTDAVDQLKESLQKIEKDIQDILNIQKEQDKNMFDKMYNIQKIIQLISIIQAVVVAIANGEVYCGPDKASQREGLEAFVSSYNKIQNNIAITLEGDQMTIRPNLPAKLSKLNKLVALYEKEGNIDLRTPVEVEEASQQLPQLTIPVVNCLKVSTDPELEKVRNFIDIM